MKAQFGIVASIVSVALGGVLFATALFFYTETPPTTPPILYPPPLSIAPEVLEAKAAVLYEPQTGRVLFAKNAGVSLPLASLTKLMTAYAVLEVKSPTTLVTITSADIVPEGDWGFIVGDVLKLSDLLKFGLVASSNDAMAAAASVLGSGYVTHLNQTAANLKLSQTYFLNPTGLDLDQETSGAYGSAYDVARLTAAFFKKYPDVFELTEAASVAIPVGSRTLSAHATALPLLDIPGFIGAKTGYTDLAGGNLTAVFDLEPGTPLVAVVLGSSEQGRFTDMRTLINAARGTL